MLIISCMRSASSSMHLFLKDFLNLDKVVYPKYTTRDWRNGEGLKDYMYYPSSTAFEIEKEILTDWVTNRKTIIQEHLLPIQHHRDVMMSIPKDKKFVTGWYRSDYSDNAMVGNWDEDFFRENLHMPFTSVDWLTKTAEEEGNKLVQVDWCGFGFTKVHRSIYEQMEYPYYPLRDAFIEKCNNPTKKGEKFDVKDLSFEDVSFCRNCYEETKIKPLVVPKMRVGHLKSFLV